MLTSQGHCRGDKLTVGSKVVIAQDTDIRGQVTIGTESVVHPKASILAIGGPITIGQGNVIEENAVIINLRKATMRIGDHNYFEVGSSEFRPANSSFPS